MENFFGPQSPVILDDLSSFRRRSLEEDNVSVNRILNWEDSEMEQYMKKFQSAQEKLIDDSGEDAFENDSMTIMALFFQVQVSLIYLWDFPFTIHCSEKILQFQYSTSKLQCYQYAKFITGLALENAPSYII